MNMNISFAIPDSRTLCHLSECTPGTFFDFADSEKKKSFVDVIVNPMESLFMVFEEMNPGKGHVDFVFMDGGGVRRRQGDRLVHVYDFRKFRAKHAGVCKAVGAFAGQGVVVFYSSNRKNKIDFLSLAEDGGVNVDERMSKHLWLVVKETPAPVGKVTLVSFAGEKVQVDDDRELHVCDVEMEFKL